MYVVETAFCVPPATMAPQQVLGTVLVVALSDRLGCALTTSRVCMQLQKHRSQRQKWSDRLAVPSATAALTAGWESIASENSFVEKGTRLAFSFQFC